MSYLNLQPEQRIICRLKIGDEYHRGIFHEFLILEVTRKALRVKDTVTGTVQILSRGLFKKEEWRVNDNEYHVVEIRRIQQAATEGGEANSADGI